MDSIKRERKINLKALPKEDAGRIMEEVGARVASIVNKAKDDMNALLNIYGQQVSLIVNQDTFTFNFQEQELEKPKAKKGRPKKEVIKD